MGAPWEQDEQIAGPWEQDQAVEAAPVAAQAIPRGKSLAVQTADMLRPEMTGKNPNLEAFGNVAADITGGFVGLGDNTIQGIKALPNILMHPIETAKAIGGAIKGNPATAASAFVPYAVKKIPGVGVVAGMTGQLIDQYRGGASANMEPADRFANMLSAGFGNATPDMLKVAKASRPAQAIAQSKPGIVAQAATEVVKQSKPVQAITEVGRKARGLPKAIVKSRLSRASGAPVEALEALVRDPMDMAGAVNASPRRWQDLAERAQKTMREAYDAESQAFEDAVKESGIVRDTVSVEDVRDPYTGNLKYTKRGGGSSDLRVITEKQDALIPPNYYEAYAAGRGVGLEDLVNQQTVDVPVGMQGARAPKVDLIPQQKTSTVVGTRIDAAPAAQRFDDLLRDKGVLTADGSRAIDFPDAARNMQVSPAEAKDLLALREQLRGVNSWDSALALRRKMDDRISWDSKQVNPIGPVSEGILKQMRDELAQSLAAADPTGKIAAANRRYAQFRKFYDEMQKKIGGDNAGDKLRLASGNENRVLMREDMERLSGARDLLGTDPDTPALPQRLPSRPSLLREGERLATGDFFRGREGITTTGRDAIMDSTIFGTGIGALAGVGIDPTLGMLLAAPAAAAYGYGTRPQVLGRNLMRYGLARQAVNPLIEAGRAGLGAASRRGLATGLLLGPKAGQE